MSNWKRAASGNVPTEEPRERTGRKRKPSGRRTPPNQFGTGTTGGGPTASHPVHGTTADGKPVTASFGQGSKDDHTFLKDGHAPTRESFWGPNYREEHDHYGNGTEKKSNGTQRGKYTGYGS